MEDFRSASITREGENEVQPLVAVTDSSRSSTFSSVLVMSLGRRRTLLRRLALVSVRTTAFSGYSMFNEKVML